MFFWKFTRSGKYSSKYISLIMDFHHSCIEQELLKTSFEECMDIMILIHDVEVLNGLSNTSSGLEKKEFQKVVNQLGYQATNFYTQRRYEEGLVQGKMTLGTHDGTPLDYGFSNRNSEKKVYLNTNNLKVSMIINAQTGRIYGTEDKLKAYRNHPLFINQGLYYDLMPMHSCMIEIVNKMMICDSAKTKEFLTNVLKWKEL